MLNNWISAILVSALLWCAIGYAITGGSRQQCTASDDVCAWELR